MGNVSDKLAGVEAPAASAPHLLLVELSDFEWVKTLGGTRLLKTLQCRYGGAPVTVKVHLKKSGAVGSNTLTERWATAFNDIRDRIAAAQAPGLLTYQRLHETERAGFLIRQHFASNLYDRFSTQPFLSALEKQWVAYQLLRSVAQMHEIGIVHGDIKSENIMMTSWNWTFLTDFAPFKPIWLADYNPTDFNFFFHGQSDQARCYIAPERFYCSSEASKFRDPSLSSAMDVFSLGCVLAEIFMEGEVLFDYSQLLQYRDHKFDPLSVLKKIDPSIRALVAHMLQLQPEERWSAKRYLDEWCPHIFPSYFPYMYDIFAKMVRPELANPESKIRFLNHAMPHIVERIFNVKLDSSNPLRANEADYVSLAMQEQLGDEDALTDDTEQMAFDRILSLVPGYMQTTDTTVGLPADSSKPKSQNRVSFWDSLSGKAESKYDIDFSSSNALIADMQNLIFQIDRDTRNFAQRIEASSSAADVLSTALSEKQPSVDQAQRVSAVVTDVSSPLPSDAAIVVLDRVVRERTTQALTPIIALVCVSVRNVRHPLIRLKAIDLLLGMAAYCDDEIRLNRIVPYLVSLLSDPAALVRARSIRVLTSVLASVQSLTVSDAHIFPDYIFPALSMMPSDPEQLVSLSYAQNISCLAETSKRFLEMGQYQKGVLMRGRQRAAVLENPEVSSKFVLENTYDTDLNQLRDTVQKVVIDILTPSHTPGAARVKRALLADTMSLTRLCVFFGRTRATNDLLPHLITVLNDRDWHLRAAFFERMTGVAAFLGPLPAKFLLPCMEQALYDAEESIITRSVHAITGLVQLRLLDSATILAVAAKCAPLLCHPSVLVRSEGIDFMIASADTLGVARTHVELMPLLRPFLHSAATPLTLVINRSNLLTWLRDPLSREIFDLALKAASVCHTDQQAAAAIDRLRAQRDGIASILASTTPAPNAPSTSESPFAKLCINADTHVLQHCIAYITQVADSFSAKLSTGAGDSDSHQTSNEAVCYSVKVPSTTPEISSGAAYAAYAALADSMNADGVLGQAGHRQAVPQSQIIFPNRRFVRSAQGLINTAATVNSASLDQVQQDLFESLGVPLPDASGSNTPMRQNSIRGRSESITLADESSQLKSVSDFDVPPVRQSHGPHPKDFYSLPQSIRRALHLPPPPPDLGWLRSNTISTSPFYNNHRDGMQRLSEPIDWRPKGLMLTQLNEHRGSVNSLSVSRDNMFLASGGDDGLVKIWNCRPFMSVAQNSSMVTYSGLRPGRVTSLTVCDSSHSVAAASSSGSLHVFRVEYQSSSVADDYSCTGVSTVRNIDVDEGAILGVEHFNSLTESLLVYATQKGGVHGWDLRADREAWRMNLDPSFGYFTALSSGPSLYSLLAGTSRGFITVWDLRFQINLQLWRHSSRTRITHLSALDAPSSFPITASSAQMVNAPSLTKGKSEQPAAGNASLYHPCGAPLFFAAAYGANEVGAFDIFSGECRELFRSRPAPTFEGVAAAAATSASTQTATTSNVSAARPSSVKRPAVNSSLPALKAYNSMKLLRAPLDDSFLKEIHTACEQFAVDRPSVNGFLCCPDAYVITAGSDATMRYFDVREPSDGYRISAPDTWPNHQPYTNVMCTASNEQNAVVFDESISLDEAAMPPIKSPAGSAAAWSLQHQRRSGPQSAPTHHTDAITDLKAIEFPRPMLVTSSRDGIIKVWT